jgi:hypothetical protein
MVLHLVQAPALMMLEEVGDRRCDPSCEVCREVALCQSVRIREPHDHPRRHEERAEQNGRRLRELAVRSEQQVFEIDRAARVAIAAHKRDQQREQNGRENDDQNDVRVHAPSLSRLKV